MTTTQGPKRVALGPSTDLAQVVENVHRDGSPRAIERNGEILAVIVSHDEFRKLNAMPTSKRQKEKLLSLAGAWNDLDADDLIDRIYKARHEAPPSKSLEA